jgi:DNA (cytosine-5)-methyltransferase 1
MMPRKLAISLFASAGIGDVACKKLGFDVIVANELISERVDLFEYNFPETKMIQGDIYEKKEEIVRESISRLNGRELDYALVTPPCQGMSKNGRGKLLSEIRNGNRPEVDPRNLLIFPALEVIRALEPKTVVFENVPEMENTIVPYKKGAETILNIIKQELSGYIVDHKVVEMANYGIPQRRQRLITIATRDQSLIQRYEFACTLFPDETHSRNSTLGKKPWITVRDAISHMESLDSRTKTKSASDPWHKVNKLDEKKYWWISKTPEGKTAFDNQCDSCGFSENLTHTAKKTKEGINRASSETPIYCSKCGSLLPRPTTEKNGEKFLMKGFTSAYKRMSWDLPASAITRNFMYVCSDNKVHPSENRTLSIREAMILHTLDESLYEWKYNSGNTVTLSSIRDALGESIPPQMLEKVFLHLESIQNGKVEELEEELGQRSLVFA